MSVEARLGNLSLDELADLEDSEDEAIIAEFRRKRLEEMKKEAEAAKFGEVIEISGVDYVQQVNKAGAGIYVVLHLYKPCVPLCTLLNQHFRSLAAKFPMVKFLKSISITCIPNFPDKNLPSVFVYYEGNLKKQFVGAHEFSDRVSCDELEWLLAGVGVLKTDLEGDPRSRVRDVMMSSLKAAANRRSRADSEDSEDDW